MDKVHPVTFCFFALTVITSSLCDEASLGDKFEVFNFTTGSAADLLAPDLAIPGNILILSSYVHQLYTADKASATLLTTESELNITHMPLFVQTTAQDFVYVMCHEWSYYSSLHDACFCHFDRKSKVSSALDSSRGTLCEPFCQLNRFYDFRPPMRAMKLDDRYNDIVYTILAFKFPTVVIFFNISKSPQYEHGNQLIQDYSEKGSNYSETALTRYTFYDLELPDVHHVKSAEQDGDFIYFIHHNGIYRINMPSFSDLQTGGFVRTSVLWVTGKGIYKFLDTDFARAEFHSPVYIVRINHTMLAVADSRSNRIRLLDLRNNVTSSLCVTGAYNIETGSTPSTCPLIKTSSLLFLNNSLYVGWMGNIGRIYHSSRADADRPQRKQDARNPHGTNIITSISVPTSLLVIASVAAVIIIRWRRKYSNSRTRQRPEPEIGRVNVSELVNCPLPTISGHIDEEEGYDMPELDDEDFYDMIGDQYYHTLVLDGDEMNKSTTPEAGSDCSENPQNIRDSRHYDDSIQIGQHSSSSVHNPDVYDSNLDRYGYLKPST